MKKRAKGTLFGRQRVFSFSLEERGSVEVVLGHVFG